MIDLNFNYNITYASGEICRRGHVLQVKVSREDYKRIMLQMLEGKALGQMDGVDDIVYAMKDLVRSVDVWYDKSDRMRNSPLKNPRDIRDIEVFLTEDECRRIRKMNNPSEVLSRSKESMRIYRNDGSSVEIITDNGLVYIKDSTKKGCTTVLENDYFVSSIL